jgi:hypothetical protein
MAQLHANPYAMFEPSLDVPAIMAAQFVPTTAPNPYWGYGNSVKFTDNDVTDDTEQFSYGESHSILESTYAPLTTSQSLKVSGLLLGVYNHG